MVCPTGIDGWMLDRTTRPLAAGPERCGGSNGYRTTTDASERHGDNATSPRRGRWFCTAFASSSLTNPASPSMASGNVLCVLRTGNIHAIDDVEPVQTQSIPYCALRPTVLRVHYFILRNHPRMQILKAGAYSSDRFNRLKCSTTGAPR